MLRSRQYSLAYLLAEVTLIALAIGLARHLYRTQNVMWPQTWWWAVPAAAIVIPAAIGGLFGKMKAGALAALLALGLFVLFALIQSIPRVY
jgi:hypothetical protein